MIDRRPNLTALYNFRKLESEHMARERKHKQHTWGSVCVWFMSVDLGEGLPPWPEVFLSLLERGPRDFLRATLRTGLSGVFGWLT